MTNAGRPLILAGSSGGNGFWQRNDRKKSYLAAVRGVAEETIKPCSGETIGVEKRCNSEMIDVETRSICSGEIEPCRRSRSSSVDNITHDVVIVDMNCDVIDGLSSCGEIVDTSIPVDLSRGGTTIGGSSVDDDFDNRFIDDGSLVDSASSSVRGDGGYRMDGERKKGKKKSFEQKGLN